MEKDSEIDGDDPKYVAAIEKFLKTLLTNYPILRYPDFKQKFTLTTDASDKAIGEVFSQQGHPISFASRTLNEHERNYSTTEKELLCIVLHLRLYLYGLKLAENGGIF